MSPFNIRTLCQIPTGDLTCVQLKAMFNKQEKLAIIYYPQIAWNTRNKNN